MARAPSSLNRPINSTRLILCEGLDEYELFTLLREERGLTDLNIEIASAEGRESFASKWADIRRQSGGLKISDVTLVFDSEDNAQATQQKMNQFVQKHQSSSLRFRLCQLPSATEAGCLETLIRQSIPSDSRGFDCATRWETCIQDNPAIAFGLQAKRDKAWLQVWLTHRTADTAYSRIGYAICHNPDLRQELDAGLAPLRQILSAALE